MSNKYIKLVAPAFKAALLLTPIFLLMLLDPSKQIDLLQDIEGLNALDARVVFSLDYIYSLLTERGITLFLTVFTFALTLSTLIRYALLETQKPDLQSNSFFLKRERIGFWAIATIFPTVLTENLLLLPIMGIICFLALRKEDGYLGLRADQFVRHLYSKRNGEA